MASSAASKLPLQPPLEVGVGRVEVVLDVGACLIVVHAVPVLLLLEHLGRV